VPTLGAFLPALLGRDEVRRASSLNHP